jgi:hypothetical protein
MASAKKILSIFLVLFSSVTIVSNAARADCSAVAECDEFLSKSTRVKARKLTDIEIRFDFYPTGPVVDLSQFSPVFMVIKQNGNAHALRYQLLFQAKNVGAYEGVLQEAEVQRLFARVRVAFSLPKYRKDYDRGLVYESDGFYLALWSHNGKVKEMFGSVETRPDEVRALVAEMSDWWKKLSEVPPAYAYLTSRAIEKDRLKLLRSKYRVGPTAIESLPAALQAFLIPAVTQPLNFYPLTQAQYNQLKAGKLAMLYKGAGYELSLFRSMNEAGTDAKK